MLIVTAEEHQINGGLFDSISQVLSRNCPTPIEAVAIFDEYGQSGTPDELMKHYHLDTEDIVEAAKRTNATVSGPIPLPTEKEVVTILRAVHKYKDSREQFEQRTHKRLIDIIRPTPKTVEALTNLEIPASVEIEIKR